MELYSPAFANNAPIPVRHTGDGDNLSPPLEWSGAPADTRSFALIMEDPDAPTGTFHHWAVFNLPRGRVGLTEGMRLTDAAQGVNDMAHARYDGPLPPRGHGLHHYHFRLAALDVDKLAISGSPTVGAVWAEALKHALATADLVGTYER